MNPLNGANKRTIFIIASCALIYFILSRFDVLWSGSADLAHAIFLTSRLMTDWSSTLPGNNLGSDLSVYPPYAFITSAVVGVLFDSPVLGVQIVFLGVLFCTWLAIALSAASGLRRKTGFVFISLIAIGLLFNGRFVKLELIGNEIISNYFYAQATSQLIAIAGIIAAARMEGRGGIMSTVAYLVLTFCVVLCVRTHAVPAVILLGFMGLLGCFDLYLAREILRGGIRSALMFALPRATIIILAFTLLVTDQSFIAMMNNAEENAGAIMLLRFTQSIPRMGLLALVVASISGFGLWRYAILSPVERDENKFQKYLMLTGLAAAILCMAQIGARLSGHGFDYAVNKYAFTLNTILALEVAFFVAILVSRLWSKDIPTRGIVQICAALLPLTLLIVPLSRPSISNTQKLFVLEQLMRHYWDLNVDLPPGKEVVAAGITDIGSIGDYLLSISPLRAPRNANAYDILQAKPFSQPEMISEIFTSPGSKWDVKDCRKHAFSAGIVIIDGPCAQAKSR